MQNKILTDDELDKLLIAYMPKANILLNQLEEERDKNMDSHVFSNRYKKSMKKIIKEYSKTTIQRRFIAFYKYVSVVLIIFLLANSLLIVTVQAYREKFFDIITNVFKTFTSIVTEKEMIPINIEPKFLEPSYIPDGFEVINDMQTEITRIIDYVNDNRIIVFKQSIITNGETKIDTEGTEIKEININQISIKYFFNKGMYYAYWNDNDYSYAVTAELPFTEFLKVIKSII